MIVNYKLERMEKVKADLLSWNLREDKHGGLQDSSCPVRYWSREPYKYELESLLLWQICVGRQFVG
jgi:hypothetical protein